MSRSPTSPPRVLLLSNFPVPYQLELLAAVEASGELALTALFLEDRDPARDWPSATRGQARVLPSLGKRLPPELQLHPTLLPELLALRPQLAIVCGYSYAAFQGALLALRALRVPVLLWAEVPRLDAGGLARRLVRGALLRQLRGVRGVLAIGTRAEGVWRAALPGVPATSFPYVCDLDRYLCIERGGARRPSFTFLFSGQLIARKGVDLLLAAFAQAAARDPSLRLTLAGDGSERTRLEASVPAALRQRVRFEGFVSWDRLPEVYAAADALVIPSRHDGWGMVVNEAFGAGLPVIASDAVGAALDLVIPGETGLLVPAGEVEPLAEALQSLPPQAERIGAAARAVARARLLPAQAAARLAAIVRRVLAGEPLVETAP